ncbi:SusC/RagA family TonB-linked outer membrane protein [Pseudoflavitalea rhizosphaerae]|uniref:SusC/RagA family TonB-linked outer membrane protein n=1 Tax=Pseudoflavitalea rhizosphaerae TaxID=1884793 RepID=UPI000F8D2918|nr:SusC/RagA family TonB-linked outer membrane protein [Pseudoflavitalea rhizosphaerae]
MKKTAPTTEVRGEDGNPSVKAPGKGGGFIKILLVMKLTTLLLTVTMLHAAAAGTGQTVSINAANMPLKKLFTEVKRQTGYTVFGRNELFRLSNTVTITASNMPLADFLQQVMLSQPLQFRINGKDIILSRKSGAATNRETSVLQTTETFATINGTVYDAEGLLLEGASIMLKRTGKTTQSDSKGQFSLDALPDDILVISFVGYTTQEIKVGNNRYLRVRLKQEEARMNDVVITGIVNRKAESFTGASVRFSRQELMQAGSRNIFQSLKSMDPALNIFENLATGSDPNKMLEMQIRGTSSFPDVKGQYATNPNQPLFIVDGFEMTIEKVNDLDINRIESVTILKDASAKALYGSRAANGVIVIETVKVKPGELRINYTGTYGIEIPDLSSYNLTNAREKITLEKELGAYYRPQPPAALIFDSLYYANLREVQNGVNTDWLAQPTRIGFSHKQTVGFEVGDDRLRTGLTLFMNNTQGVMKGSERKTIGGAFQLTYRYKKILFRNLLQYTGIKTANSPYGEFSEYARLNPYWRPYNEDGSVIKFLGIGPVLTEPVYNPLFNAMLNTTSTTNYTDLTNNTYLEYFISKSLKLVGRFGFANTVNGSDEFLPGNHTSFIGLIGENMFRKGSYNKGNGKASMVSGDLNLNYSGSWGKHSVFANLGGNIREDKSESFLYSAIGFPNDRMDNILFAKQYAENAKPTGAESISRELGVLAIGSYSYDNRYFADFSLRTSSSSQFGSANRWGSFYSVGAGWNLHHEKFFQKIPQITMLKLRGSAGYTGSQNFNAYQALLLYNYFVDDSYQGLPGVYLNGLWNPELKWQQKLDYNVGIDASIQNKLNIRVDLYKAITTNLLTDITIPPSLGFSSYKANLGQITNTGLEFRVSYRMFVNNRNRQSLNLFVTGITNRNRIVKISNSLKSLTEEQDKLSEESNKPLVRFQEGQSLEAIWAVPSRGIDPATGKEIFVKRDGSFTDQWDPLDKVVAGVNQPKLMGTAGLNFEVKGFSIGVIARYRMGGQIYNQTLVDKVENAQLNYNVDKRAYYDSWKKPGDNVLFKSIGTVNTLTLATSRFVQDLSELEISSVNIGYDFYRHAFVQKLKMQRLQVLMNMNDILRLSTVRIERGTAYPFARYCTLTVMANF